MSPVRMQKIEAPIRLVLAFVEAFNRRDPAAMGACLSANCICEEAAPAPDGAAYTGREAFIQFYTAYFQQTPPTHLQIEEIFGLGEHCIVRWARRWQDPAGGPAHLRGVDIFRVRGGEIIEKRAYVKGAA